MKLVGLHPREPKIPVYDFEVSILSGVCPILSQGYFTAGRSWIIDLAQASGARFVHMVYGSWPILGCTVRYSANGTFRIILLVIRWPINKNQGEMRDRF